MVEGILIFLYLAIGLFLGVTVSKRLMDHPDKFKSWDPIVFIPSAIFLWAPIMLVLSIGIMANDVWKQASK